MVELACANTVLTDAEPCCREEALTTAMEMMLTLPPTLIKHVDERSLVDRYDWAIDDEEGVVAIKSYRSEIDADHRGWYSDKDLFLELSRSEHAAERLESDAELGSFGPLRYTYMDKTALVHESLGDAVEIEYRVEDVEVLRSGEYRCVR